MNPHPHAETIIAWAKGSKIQVYTGEGEWVDCCPDWNYQDKYRVKPEDIERTYPETEMSGREINELQGKYFNLFGRERAGVLVVNLAFKRACDNGQIVTREEFDRAVGDRARRDMNLAEAVSHAAYKQGGPAMTVRELQNIIKGVTNV